MKQELTAPPDGGRRALQIVLAVLAVIPVVSGAVDIIAGSKWLPGGQSQTTPSMDSAFRFASIFWCAVGPLVWWHVPRVTRDSPTLPLTLSTVFAGGIARLYSWQQRGRPHSMFVGATALELIGMPVLIVWHRNVVASVKAATIGPVVQPISPGVSD